MTNKEKFLALVSKEETDTLSRIQERIANRGRNRITFAISLAILDRLDQMGWSQKRMAEAMDISPQLVNKWVRGKENFTIETISKIEEALDFKLIEVVKEPKNTCLVIPIHTHTNYEEWSNRTSDWEDRRIADEQLISIAGNS